MSCGSEHAVKLIVFDVGGVDHGVARYPLPSVVALAAILDSPSQSAQRSRARWSQIFRLNSRSSFSSSPT